MGVRSVCLVFWMVYLLHGPAYPITSRGNAGQDIFLGDDDRLGFLKIVEDVGARYNWVCHAD
ncbi:TPA: hypothetical protein DCY65_02190, partial [Candidatus Acetothermia bacterium]|nr:hypothetical protein [Candidatus Acetothermia bacterium]